MTIIELFDEVNRRVAARLPSETIKKHASRHVRYALTNKCLCEGCIEFRRAHYAFDWKLTNEKHYRYALTTGCQCAKCVWIRFQKKPLNLGNG